MSGYVIALRLISSPNLHIHLVGFFQNLPKKRFIFVFLFISYCYHWFLFENGSKSIFICFISAPKLPNFVKISVYFEKNETLCLSEIIGKEQKNETKLDFICRQYFFL